MAELVHVTHDTLDVTVDPRRGADILRIVHRPTDTSLLFETPWSDRAEAVRAGRMPTSAVDTLGRWLEGYVGGWQVLCPNSGPERRVMGSPVAFHGEAAIVPWTVVNVSPGQVRLLVDLFSVPVRIARELSVHGATVEVTDTLTNLAEVPLEFDYSMHPAISTGLLTGDVRLDTSATVFVADLEAPGAGLVAGQIYPWPPPGVQQIPGPDARVSVFGWVTEFDGPAWTTVTAVDHGLTLRLMWDKDVLPHAWLWMELGGSPGFPWFGRVRSLAFEPASTVTSGPGRAKTLTLAGRASRRITVQFDVIPSNA